MATNSIHSAVQQHYGQIARAADPDLKLQGNSCCGPSANDAACCGTLYDEAMLTSLPSSVTELSLGCGDPVTIAGLREGETVLDLGSGGGIDCFLAAQRVGASGHVIGVDMTPAMLERANANKARMNVVNVEFRQGNIEALPVADNSIDVIMSNCVINLSPDKPAVFSEALRVLKPGGRVSISDIVTEGDFSDDMRADAAKWAACVTGAIDANEYLGMMRAAGFEDAQVIDQTDADGIVEPQPGMPRIFSARITGRKPV